MLLSVLSNMATLNPVCLGSLMVHLVAACKPCSVALSMPTLR
jgi:hypothetical protein